MTMTIEEAIKHCEEVAKENEYASKKGIWFLPENEVKDIKEQCAECAADHKQLADWLRELQELREKHWGECRQIAHYDDELYQAIKRAIINNGRAVLTNMDNLDLQDENRELKKLLTIAMADLAEAEDCACCIFDSRQCPSVTGDCTFKWKYHDEAMKLIGGEEE